MPKTDILQSQSRMLLLLGNIYVNWDSPYFLTLSGFIAENTNAVGYFHILAM